MLVLASSRYTHSWTHPPVLFSFFFSISLSRGRNLLFLLKSEKKVFLCASTSHPSLPTSLPSSRCRTVGIKFSPDLFWFITVRSVWQRCNIVVTSLGLGSLSPCSLDCCRGVSPFKCFTRWPRPLDVHRSIETRSRFPLSSSIQDAMQAPTRFSYYFLSFFCLLSSYSLYFFSIFFWFYFQKHNGKSKE